MINGVKKIKGFSFKDKRGTINELNGFKVKSITHTNSLPNSLRGLHMQGWDKVVYVASGEVYTILLDTRKRSKTYKKTMKFVMKAGQGLFIPKGVANSYYVMGNEPVNYLYFNSQEYDVKKTKGLNYKLFVYPGNNPIVSEKDENNSYEY